MCINGAKNMKKRYNHAEVTKLLDKAESCAERMQQLNSEFQDQIQRKAKLAA
jgi:hypothetical protein